MTDSSKNYSLLAGSTVGRCCGSQWQIVWAHVMSRACRQSPGRRGMPACSAHAWLSRSMAGVWKARVRPQRSSATRSGTSTARRCNRLPIPWKKYLVPFSIPTPSRATRVGFKRTMHGFGPARRLPWRIGRLCRGSRMSASRARSLALWPRRGWANYALDEARCCQTSDLCAAGPP